MTKFGSIWGDIEVRAESIIPAEAKKPAEPGADPAPEKAKPVTMVATDETGDDDEEEKVIPKPAAPAKGDEEEEEEYEFTDSDVEKAYSMLVEEGVLEIGEDDEFDASPAGLADAVAATVRLKLENEIAAIPPVVQEFYAHVMAGKDEGSFVASKKGVTWDAFSIEDEVNQKAALRAYYKNQGMTDDEAEEEIEDAEAASKLDKKAAIALSSLIKEEASAKAVQARNAQAAKATEEAARTAEIKEIEKTIDTATSIAGFELDEEKRKNFKDYLFKINPRTGKSQMQENMAQEDRRMTIAFLDFVNYSKADITKEIASKLTKDRKKKLVRFTDKNVNHSNSSSSVKTKSDKNTGRITFPSIFGSQTIETED